ncbi:hypothetical protein D3C78_1217380 [compost metagenome]
MRDCSRNLPKHGKLVILQGGLFYLLILGYILYAEQKIAIQLIAIGNRYQKMLTIFVLELVVSALHQKHFLIKS